MHFFEIVWVRTIVWQVGTMITAGEVKSKDDDDDDDHPQTLIMADAEDQFVLNQVCIK